MSKDIGAALDPRRSAAVAASAGSGKTWLLVSRIVRLLLAGAPPGGILALTFTRKAAAEMRERVSARLRTLAYADEAGLLEELKLLGVIANPENCARARGLYTQLLFETFPPRIMTLHAFAQDLLTRFALEAGIAPGFKVIESPGALYRQTWQRLLDQLQQEPAGAAATAMLDLVDEGYKEPALRGLITEFLNHRADWWALTASRDSEMEDSAVDFAIERLKVALELTEDDLAGNDRPHRLDSPYFSRLLSTFHHWLVHIDGCGRIKPERFNLEVSGEARLDMLLQALCTQDGDPYAFNVGKNKIKKLTAHDLAAFYEAHTALIEGIISARDHRERLRTLRRSRAALRLATAALDALEVELDLAQSLTFSEIEWLAYRLLHRNGNAEWIRYKLDRRIDHLLVDEFQDTNPTQWNLLLPLIEEMAAGDSERQRSVFIVGDHKQSIYGFRRADPELLDIAAEWMERRLAAARVPLHASRRSAPAIIDFVNAVYQPEDVAEALKFVKHDTWRDADEWGRVEIAPLVESAEVEDAADLEFGTLRNPLTTVLGDSEEARAAMEGRIVAARIKELIRSGTVICEGSGQKPIGYGDIIVLARQRTHLLLIERALTAANIPFVGSSRGTLLETSEARDLLALLRLLASKDRDLDLAQVLRSPLFAVDDDALIQLAQAKLIAQSSWLDLLSGLTDSAELVRASTLLHRWSSFARSLPVHDLLDRIFAEGDVAARYEAALPRVSATRVRANLGALAQLALQADSGRYPTLGRFLEIARDQQESDAPNEAPVAAGEQVRVMTIHGAKGLEAAAVFLVDCGPKRASNPPAWLIDWSREHSRPNYFIARKGSDAISQRLLDERRRRESREELNLLYVAITRSRQFLHISGSKPKKGSSASWHQRMLEAFGRLGVLNAGFAGYESGRFSSLPVVEHPQPPTSDDPRLQYPLITLVSPRSVESKDDRSPAGGFRSTAADNPEAARRGTAVHRLLQWLTGPHISTDQLRTRLERQLASVISNDDFSAWLGEAEAVMNAPILARFFDPALYQHAWNEVPVVIEGESQGSVIDRLVDDGETLWILDYKTAPHPKAQLLIEQHGAQLGRYAEAVAELGLLRTIRRGLVLTATRGWIEDSQESTGDKNLGGGAHLQLP